MDDYEGVTVAGLAIVRFDGTPSVFMARRAFDEDDDPEVRETWEFPGGHLDDGEEPFAAAAREFEEEIGFPLPPGEVINGWRSEDGHYQGFVYEAVEFPAIKDWTPTEEVQEVGWFDASGVDAEQTHGRLRPEVANMDWSRIWGVSGNEEAEMPEAVTAATQVGTAEEYLRTDEDGNELARVEALTSAEPLMTVFDLAPGPIPIHGVLAPENVESGDSRGFNADALTSRPLRLPFGWQKVMAEGHMGAVTIGSIDRIMRRNGEIHWEGSLLANAESEEFLDLLVHFGRYGVSIDGDRGRLDLERSKAEGMTWFDAARISGATACAIPAFAEAYVALGPHPEMPVGDSEDALTAAGVSAEEIIGQSTFDRGPGWVTNPRETKRIHDYWTKPGQPGYAKIRWGTNGDYTRCTKLVGEKIATNSPEDLRYIKRICAQWHHDALGYWPGDLDKPGNKTTAEARAERKAAASAASDIVDATEGFEIPEDDEVAWEVVLVSSAAGGKRVRPPLDYFNRHPDTGALVIEDYDEYGLRRTHGYLAEWGVCHIGFENRCVEPPRTGSDEYPEFHLGRTRTQEGIVPTGLLTYNVEHRDAKRILTETATQNHFDNLKNAWAAVRVGEDDRGIWFSGVVLPKVDEEDVVLIEASGQISGEWKYGELRAALTVNVPGYPVERASAEFDDEGNVVALAASAFGQIPDAPCNQQDEETDDPVGELALAVLDRLEGKRRMDEARSEFTMKRFEQMKGAWS